MPSLGYPKLRISELNENSTRYDHLLAAPSDDELVSMWTGYAIAFSIFATFNAIVFLAILLNKKARQNGFNQYLLAIMLPDITYTGFCALETVALVIRGAYYGAWCRIHGFIVIFFIVSNFYLNAVVAHEVKILLQSSHKRQRYFPPTPQRICLFVSGTYLFACLLATVGILTTEIDSFQGVACMPLPGDQTRSTIAYFILMPIVFLPILYVGWVALVITRGGLLPQSGRTREIALFFFRIFLVLVIMWLPTLISLMVGIASHWVFYFVGIWAHLTGSVTSIFSLCKSDIRQATMALLCCQVRQVNGEFDNSMNGTSRRHRISQDHNVFHNNRCSSGSTSKRWSSLWLRFSRKATLPEEEPTIDNGEGVGTLEDGAMEVKICNGNDADGEDGNATKSERVGSG